MEWIVNGKCEIIKVCKLNIELIEQFVEVRKKQLLEEGEILNNDLVNNLKDYYYAHLLEGSFCAWVVKNKNQIIATSGISFVERPPYMKCINGKLGIVSSMYTLREFRRNGIAKMLLKKLIEEARIRECYIIQITASNIGIKLYESCGFEKNNNFMQYKLAQDL